MALDRDEVALRFAVTFASSRPEEWPDIQGAFLLADAFLAESAKRAPVAPVDPPVEALRFTASGSLLNPEGRNYASVTSDGYSASASSLRRPDEFAAVVSVLATSRDHAERIVAAMLAAGRAVRP